jgi:hypothetical protein
MRVYTSQGNVSPGRFRVVAGEPLGAGGVSGPETLEPGEPGAMGGPGDEGGPRQSGPRWNGAYR